MARGRISTLTVALQPSLEELRSHVAGLCLQGVLIARAMRGHCLRRIWRETFDVCSVA